MDTSDNPIDSSEWLRDPVDQEILTHDRCRDIAQRLKKEHGVKLTSAYEILGRAMGYKTWRDLLDVLDQQTPESPLIKRRTVIDERKKVRKIKDQETLRIGANEVHDEVHGKNFIRPSGRHVTSTGTIAELGGTPLNRQTVQTVHKAGPETRDRVHRKKS